MTEDEHDNELVAAWMRELAALPVDTSRLSDASQIWWKAKLLRRWDAQRTSVAPLELGERVQAATGLAGAAILLTWSWSRLQELGSRPDLSTPGLLLTITTTVLLLTAALVVGWWPRASRQ